MACKQMQTLFRCSSSSGLEGQRFRRLKLGRSEEHKLTSSLTFAVIERVHFLDIELTKAISSPQGHVRIVQRSDSRLAVLGKSALPIMHQAAIVVIKTHAVYFGMFVLVELTFHT